MSAQGSRCCSLFHCSPYGPAVLGPRGPVSAAPPRPGPCHQAPMPPVSPLHWGPAQASIHGHHPHSPVFIHHLLSFLPENDACNITMNFFNYFFNYIHLSHQIYLNQSSFNKMLLHKDEPSYNIGLEHFFFLNTEHFLSFFTQIVLKYAVNSLQMCNCVISVNPLTVSNMNKLKKKPKSQNQRAESNMVGILHTSETSQVL